MSYEGIIQGKMLAASGLVQTGPGRVMGMTVCYAAGAGPSDLILYDNTSGSGTVIWQATVEAAAGVAALYVPLNLNYSIGLYAAMGVSVTRLSFSYM